MLREFVACRRLPCRTDPHRAASGVVAAVGPAGEGNARFGRSTLRSAIGLRLIWRCFGWTSSQGSRARVTARVTKQRRAAPALVGAGAWGDGPFLAGSGARCCSSGGLLHSPAIPLPGLTVRLSAASRPLSTLFGACGTAPLTALVAAYGDVEGAWSIQRSMVFLLFVPWLDLRSDLNPL